MLEAIGWRLLELSNHGQPRRQPQWRIVHHQRPVTWPRTEAWRLRRATVRTSRSFGHPRITSGASRASRGVPARDINLRSLL